MTKLELSKSLLNIDKSIDSDKAILILDLILDTIKMTVKSGRRAEFRKFGNFIPHERSSYETVNPATGKRIRLKKRKLMRFRASESLNKSINEHGKNGVLK